jgi:hypothetical protein
VEVRILRHIADLAALPCEVVCHCPAALVEIDDERTLPLRHRCGKVARVASLAVLLDELRELHDGEAVADRWNHLADVDPSSPRVTHCGLLWVPSTARLVGDQRQVDCPECLAAAATSRAPFRPCGPCGSPSRCLREGLCAWTARRGAS